MFRKLAKYKKEEPEKFTIVIRADAETPTGLVQEIIKFGQEVGFSKFAVKAMSDESEEGG